MRLLDWLVKFLPFGRKDDRGQQPFEEHRGYERARRDVPGWWEY